MTEDQVRWTAEAEELYRSNAQSLQANSDGLPSLPEAHLALLKTVTPASTVIICKGQAIRPGFVIVGQTTNFGCSSNRDNAWIIKRPGQQETVCKVSPIPAGYVIVGQTTNFGCSSNLDNAWIIKLPGQQETVCKASPIPPGYVIVGQTTNFGCPSNLDNAWILRRV